MSKYLVNPNLDGLKGALHICGKVNITSVGMFGILFNSVLLQRGHAFFFNQEENASENRTATSVQEHRSQHLNSIFFGGGGVTSPLPPRIDRYSKTPLPQVKFCVLISDEKACYSLFSPGTNSPIS